MSTCSIMDDRKVPPTQFNGKCVKNGTCTRDAQFETLSDGTMPCVPGSVCCISESVPCG